MIRNCVQTNGVIMWKTLDTDEATSERTQNTYTHCAATSRGRLYAILCLSACVFFLSRLRVEKNVSKSGTDLFYGWPSSHVYVLCVVVCM